MRNPRFTAAALAGVVMSLAFTGAVAEEADGCGQFSWNVSHELAVMKQTPRLLAAAVNDSGNSPQLDTDRLYEVTLAAQGSVAYALAPGKPALIDSPRGGLVHFRVARAGVYRVSVSSAHWIDVIAEGEFIASRGFQSARGCERPHKIVEFALPAGKDLILQFSGAAPPSILVAITSTAIPAVG